MQHQRRTPFVELYETSGDGPSVAVKDCIDIAGRPTICGSCALAETPPATADASVVEGLRKRGFRIAAKATMHELAYGMTGINEWAGTPENPRFPHLIPGGSSSGSAAAVAAGLVDIALGSDTGGSIRLPAACCQVIGFKPSYGRLSRIGVHPAASSLDCVGVFANRVDLIDAAMAAMDTTYQPMPAAEPARIGIVQTAARADISGAVRTACRTAAAETGDVVLDLLDDAFHAGVVLMAAEALEAYGHLAGSGLLGKDVEARLLAAPGVATQERVAWALDVRHAFIRQVDAALATYDVLALPTLPDLPPALDELGDPAAVLQLSSLVRPFNLSGHPAISLPLAAVADRPCAIQLVGAHGGDALLCALARPIAHSHDQA